MSSPTTVPFFSPTGELGDIPAAQAQAALKAGGKPAVQFKAPDGSLGFIPADRMQEAAAKGGTVIPFGSEQQPEQPGKLATAWQDIKAAASAVPGMMGAMVGPTPVPMGGTSVAVSNPGAQFAQQGADVAVADQQRKAQGRGRSYRTAAGVAQLAGANVSGMEQAAAEGNPNAVIGHAVAGAAPYAAALGLGIAGRGAAPEPQSAPVETAAPKPAEAAPTQVQATPAAAPQITDAPPVNPDLAEPARTTAGAGPRTLSGESALRTVLGGMDVKSLLKIAKSRDLSVSAEQQLKAGRAAPRLIEKIINSYTGDELDEFRSTYIENTRQPLPKGIGPEAYQSAAMATYWPDLHLSNARLTRMGKAMLGATR